jgi:hypothetical protein
MPFSKPSARAKKIHSLFMRRSYAAYRDLRKRSGLTELPFTVEELREQIRTALDDGTCAYLGVLGETLTVKNFSVDHATPISRSGSHKLDTSSFAAAAETWQDYEFNLLPAVRAARESRVGFTRPVLASNKPARPRSLTSERTTSCLKRPNLLTRFPGTVTQSLVPEQGS